MPLDDDISADDLKVFLEETDSLIDSLDENFVRLEQESENPEIVQEIFRAAHTLKGSSGMLGLSEMAGLTHEMEDTLDRVRKGTLAVTAELVDALLVSLDGLKVMRDQLRAGEDIDIDVTPLVAELQAASNAETAAGATADAAPEQTLDALLAADVEAQERLRAAHERSDVRLVRVVVEVNPESEWGAVRCFQVLNELASKVDVIFSVPSIEEIEAEAAGHHIEVLIATAEDVLHVPAHIEGVAELVDVTAAYWEARTIDESVADGRERRTIDLGPEARGKNQREMLEMASQKIETMQTVRIDVDRLDQLMNLVGELVIDRTRISQLSHVLSTAHKDDEPVRVLSETADHIEKVVDELHESMMQVRMLPVGVLFSKFPRLVRDLARNLGKNVEFVIEGEGTEIDRSVIEKLKDPLVHMIRNALDHGVETTAERADVGKSETSVVRLSAAHEQGQILITLEDDGRGIDPETIRASAVKKGVLSQEAADRLSSSEVIDLIFAAGFSTAAATTEVSGRGVGMDVVRRDIDAINGRVEVVSQVGTGSKFILRLPLTLATFGGLLVESGGQVYAMPLHYIHETVRIDPEQLESVMKRPMMTLRDRVMPLVRLNEAVSRDVPRGAGAVDEQVFAVVVQDGTGENSRPVAVAVNDLVDQQEIIVKSLSRHLGRTRSISGASILGDGQVVLIVDVPTIIKDALTAKAEGASTDRRVA